MLPFFTKRYGNPSSQHELGEQALEAINEARKKIAKEINAQPEEIYFTSGATESNNLALQGIAAKKILVSAIEHPSVYETAHALKKETIVPVNRGGLVELEFIKKNTNTQTLVSIMHVNNVFGTIQDIEKIGQLCNDNNAIFHTDAAQSFGKLNINVKKMNIDLLSASAHKIGGPKGAGILYVRKGTRISPLFYGGGQERNLRSGTENVPAIVGFSKALDLIKKINTKKIEKTRNKFFTELEKIGGKINGDKKQRIYNNVHVSFPKIDSETLVQFLSRKKIYVSSGSACESKKENSDYVLQAIGIERKNRKTSLRITLDEKISEKNIEFVIEEIKNALKILTVESKHI